MIQRLQSLWLLIAAALMALFCTQPLMWLVNNAAPSIATALTPMQMPDTLCVGIVTSLLLLIAIFLFKNMKRQKTVVKCSIMLTIVEIAVLAFTAFTFNGENGKPAVASYNWSLALPVVSLLFSIAGYRYIRRDENLLKAADRLR